MHRSRLLASLLPLLLSGAACEAIADPPAAPAPPTVPADINDAPSAAEVAATLAEIQDIARWTKAVQDGDSAALSHAFNGWSRVLIRLSTADRRADADRLCDAIVALHARLPKDAVQARENTVANAFIRDAFRVGGRRVEAAQFFVPEPYYPNDPNLTKLYRFSVYEGKDVVLRYYLEHSQLGEQHYYVLGKADPKTRAHYQVQPYGGSAPGYWTLQQRVVRDMNDPNPHYGAGSGPSK